MRLRQARWISASLALAAVLVGALAPGRAEGQANVVGEWKLLTTASPINPIHVGLLRTGKILIASGSENDPTHTTFRAAVWDPKTRTFAIQPVPWDLFCNAMSYLPDGRVLITGGNKQYNPFRGLKTTTVFDPAIEKFIQVQDMARGRWYPSNAALADGRTMTFSGWLETAGVPNQAVELYSVPTGWSPEFNAPWTPPLYPWLHLLPSGKVFVSGSKPDSHLFDPASRAWTVNMARTVYGQDRRYGSSVLLPLRAEEGYRARVMIMGGNNPATATAEIIDLGAATPAWRSLPPMSAPRIEMNAVLLPTGKVLALGGSARDNDATTASLNADLFDPATETWSPAGRAAVPRLYHSAALLLPDATVWVAGSNPFQGSWDNRMEIYSPAYLFTKDATGKVVPAARPTITSAPARVGYGASFSVQTPHAATIGSVALMRPGSATHAFDFEQRLVSLGFTKGSGMVTVTAPPSSTVAPPGYYMLFLINAQGVPSVARFVQVAPRPTNQTPEGTILSPATDVTIKAGQSVTFSGDGTDPDGSATTFSWVFPGGSPATSTVPTPGAVTFAKPGTYIVSLTVTDNLGDNDPSPPARVITVAPAAFTASFTTPPEGATVNGTQTVGLAVAGGGTPPFTYRLKIDGTQVFAHTTSGTTDFYSWNTATVADGAHTLALTVTDSTGQVSTATRTVTVANASGAIKVTLTTPTPDQTVSGTVWVNVWVSGAAGPYNFTMSAAGATVWTESSANTHVALPWDTTKTPDGPQTLTVTVQTSIRTGSTTVNVTVQNGGGGGGPLTAAITSPAESATVSGTTTVTMSASGGSPNYTFTLRIDDAVVLSQSGPATTASYAWDTPASGNGAHTLSLTVTDGGGRSATATRTVTVNNSSAGSLTIALTSPRPGETVSDTVWANVWVEAPHGTAPYAYTLTVAGAIVASQSSSATHATLAWDTTRSPGGAQTLTAAVRDAAGRTGSASVNVTVQGGGGEPAPLTAAFTSPTEGATVGGTVVVGLAASGGSPAYRYTLELDAVQVFTTTTAGTAASYSWDTTAAAPGAHTLRLTVTDSTDASATAVRGVSVNNSGGGGTLTIALSTPRPGEAVTGWNWANIWVNSPGTPPFTYTISVGATTLWTESSSSTHVTLPWDTTRVPNGPATLTVSVQDAAGRSGTATVDILVQNP
jgi:galactose oxidase-like protein/glyoxal oxidase-like protein/PKD domain-containing protein/Big-like domain-containing protein